MPHQKNVILIFTVSIKQNLVLQKKNWSLHPSINRNKPSNHVAHQQVAF